MSAPAGLTLDDIWEFDPHARRRVIASLDMSEDCLWGHLLATRRAALYTPWRFTLDADLLVYHVSGPHSVYVALKIPVSEEAMSTFPVYESQAHITISYGLQMDFDAPHAWKRYWATKHQLINVLGPRRIVSMICGKATGDERGRLFPIHHECELHTIIMMLRTVIEAAGPELTDMNLHELHISWLKMLARGS